MKKQRIFLYSILFIIMVFTTTLYLYNKSLQLSDYIKSKIINILSSNTSMKVTLEEFYINPFLLIIEFKGLTFYDNTSTPLLKIKKAYLFINYYSLFIKRKIRINKLKVYEPEVILDVQNIPLLPFSINGKKDKDPLIKNLIIKNGKFKVISKEHFFTGKISMSLSYDKDKIYVKKITIKSDSSFLKASGSVKDSYLNFKLNGNIRIEKFLQVLIQPNMIKGRVTFKGILKGEINNPVIKFDTWVENGYIYGANIEKMKCKTEYFNGKIKFYKAKIKTMGGEALAEALIKLPYNSKRAWYEFKIKAYSLNSEPLLRLIGWQPLYSLPQGKISGILISSGNFFKPKGFFIYKVIPKKSKGIFRNLKKIKGYFNLSDSLLSLSSLKIFTQGCITETTGLIDIKNKKLYLNSLIELKNLSKILNISIIPIGTEAYGKMSMSIIGNFNSPEIFISGKLCGVKYKYKNFGCVVFDLYYKKGLFTIKQAVGKVSLDKKNINSRWNIQGILVINTQNKVPFLSIKADFKKFPIDYLKLLNLSIPTSDDSIISSSVILKGPIKNPFVKGNIFVEGFKIKSFDIGNIKAEFKIKNSSLTFENFIIFKKKSFLQGKCIIDKNIIKTSPIQIKLDQKLVSSIIKDITGVNIPLFLMFKGEASVSGKLYSPKLKLQGTLYAKTSDTIWMKVSKINGSILLNKELIWNIVATIEKCSYEELIAPFIKDQPEELLFLLGGSINIKGKKDVFMAKVNLTTFRLSLYEKMLINQGDIIIFYDGKTIKLNNFKITTGNAVVEITGNIVPFSELQITFYGNTYLGPYLAALNVVPFFSSLKSLKGKAEFVFSLSGNWKKPVIYGGITLKDTYLQIKGINYSIQAIQGYAYIDENRLVIEELNGMFAGGHFSIKGGGIIQGKRFKDYNFDISINRMKIEIFDKVNLEVSCELLLTETQDETLLTGDVRILKGRFYRDIDYRGMLIKRKKRFVTHKSKIYKKLLLNINLYGDENILVKNNILNASVKIDLLITGTAYSPSIIGKIELIKGKVFFRNNEFSVIKASADFTSLDEINPYIMINAETKVRNYHITMRLNGYIDKFNVTLNSEPELDEMDILSLLTIGNLSSELKGFMGGISASEATMFITGELKETIEERIKSITGFDRIEVEPYVSEKTLGPRITVSKRLFSDKLSVIYTTTAGKETETLIKIVFSISDKISLVGEKDELGLIGGDIKFRLEFQ